MSMMMIIIIVVVVLLILKQLTEGEAAAIAIATMIGGGKVVVAGIGMAHDASKCLIVDIIVGHVMGNDGRIVELDDERVVVVILLGIRRRRFQLELVRHECQKTHVDAARDGEQVIVNHT